MLRIETIGEKVVALEAEINGRLISGADAVPIFEKALKEGEGYVEIIELDTNKVMIDLEESPDAVVNILIPITEATLRFSILHAAAKGNLALLGELLSDVSFSECLVIEGLMNSNCEGVIRGEICPDKVNIHVHVNDKSYAASKIDDIKSIMNIVSEECGMAEVIMKKA